MSMRHINDQMGESIDLLSLKSGSRDYFSSWQLLFGKNISDYLFKNQSEKGIKISKNVLTQTPPTPSGLQFGETAGQPGEPTVQ